VFGKEKEKQSTQANIFLLPTSYTREGQPLSIIKAFSFSIPVISFNLKGIPEMVEFWKTGVFVKPKAPRSIASAIIDITEDSGRYSNMSLAACEHYEANFRRDVHLERLISVILDCPESEVSYLLNR
jgi:glycosyltransferase involved in cell wall biosynthesis